MRLRNNRSFIHSFVHFENESKDQKKKPSKRIIMKDSKVEVLSEIRLPKVGLEKLSHPSSHLTVLDSKVPPCYVSFSWLYKGRFAVDLDAFAAGLDRLLAHPDYRTVLTADYKKAEYLKLLEIWYSNSNSQVLQFWYLKYRSIPIHQFKLSNTFISRKVTQFF